MLLTAIEKGVKVRAVALTQGGQVPPVTFMVRADSGIKSAADVSRRLLHDAGVVTVPGEAFGTREHVRFSYATSAGEIDRGLERLRKFFGAL